MLYSNYLKQRSNNRAATGQDHVRHERDQFRRVSATAIGVGRAPTVVDLQVATDGPAQLLQPLCQRSDAGRRFRVVGGQVHQCADPPHLLALLRARRERPRCRAPEQRG